MTDAATIARGLTNAQREAKGALAAGFALAEQFRTYGDERHAAGYQAAIADIVEWLESDGVLITARAVARRFGKDA